MMKAFTKLVTFFTLKPATIFLLAEAYFYLGWASILKKLPFNKIAFTLGEHMDESSQELIGEESKAIKNISNAIHIASNYTFWESQCLVKALAGMKMLERRGIDSTLYLGTARDKTGKMIAHAWLRSGPLYISGAEGKEQFTIVSMFSKRISR